MSEVKKIGAHLLEDELTHKLTKKIEMDDLDPELRTFIKNKNLNPDGYNDDELRTRIINIENKMAASTTARDIADLQNKVNKNANDISNLDTKKIDKTEAEELKRNIQFSDLDSTTRQKIDKSFSYYQNVMPSGNIDLVADFAAVTSAVDYLRDNMVKKNDLLSYTKNTDIIANSRLETTAQTAIAKALNGGGSSSGGGTISGNYRSIEVPINYDDLDTSLQNKINGLSEAAADLNAGVKSESEKIRDSMNTYTIGYIGGSLRNSNDTYYINATNTEKGKFTESKAGTTSNGGKTRTASFDMYQQRQIIKNVGNKKLYDPLDERNTIDDTGKFVVNEATGVSDVYKIIDILCWLYYDTIGDFELLSSNFQTEVCENSKDRNVKLSNPAYMGVAYQIFPLMDAIIYLTSRIRNLEAIIKKMCDENKLKTKYFSSHTLSTVDNTETPNAQNTNIPNRLKANNTSGNY